MVLQLCNNVVPFRLTFLDSIQWGKRKKRQIELQFLPPEFGSVYIKKNAQKPNHAPTKSLHLQKIPAFTLFVMRMLPSLPIGLSPTQALIVLQSHYHTLTFGQKAQIVQSSTHILCTFETPARFVLTATQSPPL
jgi:hypothetical protein